LLGETMYVGFSYVFFALGFLWLLAEVKRNVGARNSGFPIFAIQLSFRAMAKFQRCSSGVSIRLFESTGISPYVA